jgi:tetrahydromethanopterin S-methyltransferase subunit G
MSDEKLKEIESKLDEMHSDLEYLMKQHGRFTGFCYGIGGAFFIFYLLGLYDLIPF